VHKRVIVHAISDQSVNSLAGDPGSLVVVEGTVGRYITGCMEVYLSSILFVVLLLLKLEYADLTSDAVDGMVTGGALMVATGDRNTHFVG
jgi:hypothetical protein